MRMSRRTGIYSQGGVKQPEYTGTYTISRVGNKTYMHLLTSGVLTIKSTSFYDIFAVGGGASGWGYSNEDSGAAGGGSGYTATKLNEKLTAKSVYNVQIGAGGDGNDRNGIPLAGGTTIVDALINAKGGTDSNSTYGLGYRSGTDGGSGGGAWYGKAGGSDGADGQNNNVSAGNYKGYGGKGQGTTTRAFGESTGTLYAGAGGAGNTGSAGTAGGAGGSGGGGAGGVSGKAGSAGTENTGGGGGGSGRNNDKSGKGGSGLVIIRW